MGDGRELTPKGIHEGGALAGRRPAAFAPPARAGCGHGFYVAVARAELRK